MHVTWPLIGHKRSPVIWELGRDIRGAGAAAHPGVGEDLLDDVNLRTIIGVRVGVDLDNDKIHRIDSLVGFANLRNRFYLVTVTVTNLTVTLLQIIKTGSFCESEPYFLEMSKASIGQNIHLERKEG